MTLNELSMMMWYAQELIIVEGKMPETANTDKIRETAIFSGDNMELRSDNYKDLKSRIIQSIGAIDDFVIVTLKK